MHRGGIEYVCDQYFTGDEGVTYFINNLSEVYQMNHTEGKEPGKVLVLRDY